MAAASGNTKSLRKRLQRQLEFYLGASNLRQDKFLQQHMDESGFLPASLFLSFNKLKALRATEKMVLEVASKSDTLRVDEQHAAIAPSEVVLQELEDDGSADARTIYVEGYDVAIHDHDSLRKLFAMFGKVRLVSMPRFAQSRQFKGFAFVELSTEDAAEMALQATRALDQRTEALRGLKAMSKRQWLDMKDKLKKQLQLAVGSQQPEETAQKVRIDQSESISSSDAVSVSGHVRFRDEGDEEEEEEATKEQRLDHKRQRASSQ